MLIGRRGYQAALHVHCTMYILWNIDPIIRIIGKKIEITFEILKNKEYSCRLIFPQFSAWYPIAAACKVCRINIISLICVISFHSHNFEKWWELLKTPQSTTCTFYKWNIRVSNDFFSPDPWWRPGLLSSHRQILRLEFPAHHHQLRGLPVAQVPRNLWQKLVFIICHWRFVSDGTIQYNGFRAVYEFIPNPLESIPFISKCEFEIGGATDYIGECYLASRIS